MKGLLYKTVGPIPKGAPIVDTSLARDSFPALAGNDYAYLNSGASGPPPYHVVEASREADELCSGRAYLEGAGLFLRQAATNSRARVAAARL
ncbi:MAG: hypothetical protein M3P70_00890, partial [Actinomycetota bacterium]|nr:hypothetical protein [Actinomycetota bacterium]